MFLSREGRMRVASMRAIYRALAGFSELGWIRCFQHTLDFFTEDFKDFNERQPLIPRGFAVWRRVFLLTEKHSKHPIQHRLRRVTIKGATCDLLIMIEWSILFVCFGS
jgi:hypothetical protein